MANFDIDKKQLQDEVVLDDNQLVCVLTNSIKTATEKELLLQSISTRWTRNMNLIFPI